MAELAAPVDVATARREGRRHDAARRLLRNRAAVIGLIVIGVFGLMALAAPLVDRYDPAEQHLDDALEGPSASFWLGTDQLGRDQYSRLVHGARVSLAVGLLTQTIAVGLGVSVGLAAGMGGRRADALLMRLTDVAYAFPDLLMIILLVSIFGSSVTMLVLAIGLVSWTTIARLVRGQVLSLREEEFVLAARALGASDWRIAWRHLLPNVMSPVIVAATFGVPAAMFAEAALAFIGLGLPPPAASWGRLVTDSFDTIRVAPHLAVTSCLAVALTMMSFSFLGDGLRDALDPRAPSGRGLGEEGEGSAGASGRTGYEGRKAA
ncbi:MAG: ABC transporter permease [Dehalococcoidia bacterium]|nr:ABC transporter permease [Dehalococcoidia bacterium]